MSGVVINAVLKKFKNNFQFNRPPEQEPNKRGIPQLRSAG